MDIKTEHVSLEVAKKLKEIGYDEVGTHYYDEASGVHPPKLEHNHKFHYNYISYVFAAPTYEEVQKWLQEHKGINVVLQTYEEALLHAIQTVKAHEERLIKTDDKE